MRVLVTGGGGYLGCILTQKLLNEGHSVRVFDTFIFGPKPLSHLKGNRGLELAKGDIRNMVSVVKSLQGIDAVIHLASIVGDQAGSLEPRTTQEINYLATRNIAELCTLYKKRFLFASTCSVYGERDDTVMTENSRLMKPVSLYGQTKLQSEIGIRDTCSDHTILRLGTLFGYSSRMRFDLAINIMTAKALNKEKIQVYGGKQWRPFIHVADAAEAFVYALENDLKGSYNTSWKNFRIEKIAKIISDRYGVELEHAKKITDKRSYRVNTDKLLNTGFKPLRDIEFAMDEIETAFKEKKVGNYKNPKYSNFRSLFESKEIQQKLFTLGPLVNLNEGK